MEVVDIRVGLLEPGATTQGKVLNVLGDRITIKATGEDTGGLYALHEIVSPPQGGPPPHIHHRENEAFYVLEGEYEFRVGDRTINAREGTFLFAPMGIPHAFRNPGEVTARMVMVASPPGIECFFEEMDELCAPGMPSLEQITEVADRYGIEMIQP